jgi:hypothetical protein
MRDTIDMAREAGAIHIHGKPKEFAIVGNDNIKDFETLVRADEREAFAKIQFESLLQAIRIEREACAKVCDTTPPYPFRPSIEAAHAIRARGNT